MTDVFAFASRVAMTIFERAKKVMLFDAGEFGESRIPCPRFQRPSHARTSLRARSRSTNMPLSRINDELLEQFKSVFLCVSGAQLERLLPPCGPQAADPFVLIALELVGHPEQRAEDDGAIIAGQVHDASFHDEAAEFDEVPRPLAALDLPCAHVMSRPCGLIPVARCQVAPERRQCGAQLPVQFAAPGSERTRPRA